MSVTCVAVCARRSLKLTVSVVMICMLTFSLGPLSAPGWRRQIGQVTRPALHTTQRSVLVTSLDGVHTSLLQPEAHDVVPNLVHYVWFGRDVPFAFHHGLSLLSAHKYIGPEQMLFHCDHQPVGSWWQYVKKRVPSLRVVTRQPVRSIYGKKVLYAEHQSDLARLDILRQYGGIYLDTDVIALRSFQPLRKYNLTMGIEYHGRPGRLNNGIIIANPSSPFLRIWQETYKNFTKTEWDYHDCIIPYNLQFIYPHLIHVEEKTLNYPSGKQLDSIYNERFDWSNNYAIHLWHRLHGLEHTAHDIRSMNTTFGEIARLVFYNTTKLMH